MREAGLAGLLDEDADRRLGALLGRAPSSRRPRRAASAVGRCCARRSGSWGPGRAPSGSARGRPRARPAPRAPWRGGSRPPRPGPADQPTVRLGRLGPLRLRRLLDRRLRQLALVAGLIGCARRLGFEFGEGQGRASFRGSQRTHKRRAHRGSGISQARSACKRALIRAVSQSGRTFGTCLVARARDLVNEALLGRQTGPRRSRVWPTSQPVMWGLLRSCRACSWRHPVAWRIAGARIGRYRAIWLPEQSVHDCGDNRRRGGGTRARPAGTRPQATRPAQLGRSTRPAQLGPPYGRRRRFQPMTTTDRTSSSPTCHRQRGSRRIDGVVRIERIPQVEEQRQQGRAPAAAGSPSRGGAPRRAPRPPHIRNPR